MGYIIAIIVGLVVVWFLWKYMLHPFLTFIVALLGGATQVIIHFLQYSLWDTQGGNIILSAFLLILLTIALHIFFLRRADRKEPLCTYEDDYRQAAVDHVVTQLKRKTNEPYVEEIGGCVKTFIGRFFTWCAILAFAVASFVLSYQNIFALCFCGLGVILALFYCIQFLLVKPEKDLAPNKVTPKDR